MLLRIVSVFKFRIWHGHDSSRRYLHPKYRYRHSQIKFEISTRINTVLVHSFCSRYDLNRSPGDAFTWMNIAGFASGTFCQILGEYRPAVILNLFRKPGESTWEVLVKSVKTASTCQYIDVHEAIDYIFIHDNQSSVYKATYLVILHYTCWLFRYPCTRSLHTLCAWLRRPKGRNPGI